MKVLSPKWVYDGRDIVVMESHPHGTYAPILSTSIDPTCLAQFGPCRDCVACLPTRCRADGSRYRI
jgi:hypothetical protein